MKKRIIITALLALVTLMGWAQEKPDTITINFQLASKTKGEAVGVLYPDFVALENSALQPVTDDNGQLTVKIPAYRTLHIGIGNLNKIRKVFSEGIDLFCRPGTETNILLDDINNRCLFTGENAEAHQAQFDHPLKIENFNGKINMFEILDIQATAQSIRDTHEQNLHRIDSLSTAHPNLPGDYVEALRAIANYGFAKNMIDNVFGHFAQNMGKFIENGNTLPKEYVDLLHEAEIHELLDPNRFITFDALYYFSLMVRLEDMVQYGIMQEIPGEEPDFKLYRFKQQCSVIDALDASDEVKQMIKSCYFLNNCELDLTPERKEYLRSQLTAEYFGRLQDHINQTLAANAPVSAEEAEALAKKSIENMENGKEIFQKLIAPYRGRVIYVDFWGTWCGPCMKEMGHLEALHKALKGLPVTYMYFANKSPEDAWLKASQTIGLDGENCVNLLLPHNQQQVVEEYLNISSFPTYMLVDTNGTIVTKNAPRPSAASSVREAVTKLLNQ